MEFYKCLPNNNYAQFKLYAVPEKFKRWKYVRFHYRLAVTDESSQSVLLMSYL